MFKQVSANKAAVTLHGDASSSPKTKRMAMSAAERRAVVDAWPCFGHYRDAPREELTLFTLEGIVMRRMELLAHIDNLRNSPSITGSRDLVERVRKLLKKEDIEATGMRGGTPVHEAVDKPMDELWKGVSFSGDELRYSFSPVDDALSHLCCRLVFSQSDTWRDWFVKNEEVIFQARLETLLKSSKGYMQPLLEAVGMPCERVDEAALPAPILGWLVKLAQREERRQSGVHEETKREFYRVPLSHALKLVRNRQCVVVAGRALVPADRLQDAYMNEFRRRVRAGLDEAAIIRQRVLGSADPGTGLANTMAMLDAFFARFIVDPSDSLKPVVTGTVTAADVPRLAEQHFPLCMKRTDEHVRKERHLKHHGRWMYGLFLKAIGLTMQDAVTLFGSLLTLKAPKDFQKSSYAYNIRHMYGKEGKGTSYSSLTCATIVNLPPNVDRHDCHGCPYRFKSETELRQLLGAPRPSPVPAQQQQGPVRLSTHDIEDIVQDAKDMHYTRACFKYFAATHRGAPIQRDTLFRSPREYFQFSMSVWEQAAAVNPAAGQGADDGITPKRGRDSAPSAPSQRTLFQPSAEKQQQQGASP